MTTLPWMHADVIPAIRAIMALRYRLVPCLYTGMRKMEKRAKTRIKTLYVAGGGSQSGEICQITADMFG